jgi:hypothetical protein
MKRNEVRRTDDEVWMAKEKSGRPGLGNPFRLTTPYPSFLPRRPALKEGSFDTFSMKTKLTPLLC